MLDIDTKPKQFDVTKSFGMEEKKPIIVDGKKPPLYYEKKPVERLNQTNDYKPIKICRYMSLEEIDTKPV